MSKVSEFNPISEIFGTNIAIVNMQLKGGLISHLTCLVHVPYFGKLKILKVMNLASNCMCSHC